MGYLSADFSRGVSGSTISTADPGDDQAYDGVTTVAGGTLAYDEVHSYSPSALSLKVATGATTGTLGFDWTASLGTVTDFYGRAYLYLAANPTTVPHRFVRDRLAGVTKYSVEITTSGFVQINSDASTSVGTGAVAVSLNQWVRIEWHFIHSATVGQIEAKLFNSAESTTATETITSAANLTTAASADSVQFGNWQSTTNEPAFWIAGVAANWDRYPGPLSAPSGDRRRSPKIIVPR